MSTTMAVGVSEQAMKKRDIQPSQLLLKGNLRIDDTIRLTKCCTLYRRQRERTKANHEFPVERKIAARYCVLGNSLT